MGTLRISEIFNEPGLVLIAIVSVDFRYSNSNTICRMHGKIEPIAVIACAPNATFAFDIEAKPADLDQLRQDIPELDATIALYQKH